MFSSAFFLFIATGSFSSMFVMGTTPCMRLMRFSVIKLILNFAVQTGSCSYGCTSYKNDTPVISTAVPTSGIAASASTGAASPAPEALALGAFYYL